MTGQGGALWSWELPNFIVGRHVVLLDLGGFFVLSTRRAEFKGSNDAVCPQATGATPEGLLASPVSTSSKVKKLVGSCGVCPHAGNVSFWADFLDFQEVTVFQEFLTPVAASLSFQPLEAEESRCPPRLPPLQQCCCLWEPILGVFDCKKDFHECERMGRPGRGDFPLGF